jgi:hypothetical protein
VVGHIQKVLGGSLDNARRQPISVRDGYRCWAGAVRTSENFTSRHWRENSPGGTSFSSPGGRSRSDGQLV